MSDKIEEAQEDAEMNMTPMIDVVFLLIIFFLCIDFKVLESKLDAYLPKDKGSQTTEAPPQEQWSLKVLCENKGTKITRLPNMGQRKTEGLVVNGKLANRLIEKPYKLDNHVVIWELEGEKIRDIAELKRVMKDLYDNRELWQVDPKDNELKPRSVVIEPGVNSMYKDVANTVDVVRSTGFLEINFGGGMGSEVTGGELRGRKYLPGGG